MALVKKYKVPDEVLLKGNSRMWLHLFKAMPREEFMAYPQTVRNFDQMSMAEYYAYKRMLKAREDDKIWESIQKTTEGIPAMQGTIQGDKLFYAPYEAKEVRDGEKNGIMETINGEKRMLTPELKDGKLVVTFLGKDYEIKPGQRKIKIDGVNFEILPPPLEATTEKAEPEPKEEPKAEKPAPKKPAKKQTKKTK